MLDIGSPPSGTMNGGNRDEDAFRAIEPHLVAVAEDAVAAGWQDIEAIAVMVGVALDRAIEGAGVKGAEDFLLAALEQLRRVKV